MSDKFSIQVNDHEYCVTPSLSPYGETLDNFTIETKCEYLFTIGFKENEWTILDRKVEALDDNLVQQIGFEIEKTMASEK